MFFFDFLSPGIYSIILSIASFLWLGAFTANYVRDLVNSHESNEIVETHIVNDSRQNFESNTAYYARLKKADCQIVSCFYTSTFILTLKEATSIYIPNADIHQHPFDFTFFTRPPPSLA